MRSCTTGSSVSHPTSEGTVGLRRRGETCSRTYKIFETFGVMSTSWPRSSSETSGSTWASAKTLHQRELMNAFRECEKFVVDFGNPMGLLDLLKNSIKFVFFVLEDPGAVYSVFEVLNSRGLNVDWLDKMKSTLMGIAFEKKRKLPGGELDHVENEWTEIYRVLGREQVPD